jgi:hypothetical protein
LFPVVVMVRLWWVAIPGGRAESAQMLRTPMVVQAVPLRRGWPYTLWAGSCTIIRV